MADLSKTIQIVFESVDNTANTISQISGDLEKMASSVEEATQPLADATTAILAMETAAAALGAALVKVAVDEAGQFEQSISEINTVLGLTPEQLGQFEDDILAYAQTSTQSIESINKAIYAAVSAGTSYENALASLTTAEKLAVAGNADLEESITLLTATTNAYGPALSGAEEAADIFFQTVQLGATTVPELNQSLGEVVPVAAALGVPLEEIGAVLATVTTNGIGTAEATTGLKAALSNIISPSKEAEEAAKALGVEFGATALESDGLVGLLNNLYKATGGNAEEMKKLFGSTEAYTTVMSLTNDGAEKLNANLGKLENSTGSTAKAAEEMAGSLENVNQRMTNSIDAVLIRMGDEVLDEYKTLLESFSGLFNELANSIDEGSLDEPLAIIEEFLNEFSAMVDEIAEALPEALGQLDWTEFEQAMSDLSNSLDGLFDEVDLTTPEGLAAAIQALIDVGTSFINVTGGIVTGLEPLFDIIGTVIKAFTELDPAIQTALGVFLGLSTTVNTVAGVFATFSGLITGAGGMIAAFTALNPVVQAVAVGFAAYEFGKWIGDISGFNEAWDKTVGQLNLVGETNQATVEGLEKLDDELKKISETTGVTVTSSKELEKAVADGVLVYDQASNTYRNFTEYLDDWGSTAGLASEDAIKLAEAMLESGEMSQEAFDQFMAGDQSLESLRATLDQTGTSMTALGETTTDLTKSAAYWGDALDAVREKYEAGYLTQEQYAAAVKAINDAAKSAGVELVTMADNSEVAAKSAQEMAEASEKFALEWEKLASAERTALFEARADIEVAQIEADAERTVAAMEMLSASFQSTGEVLTELIGLWAEMEGTDQQQMTEWIEREYEMREQLAQAQIDLIEAEIARMEAQTALLERGGVELTIQSDGLEPELEAFMFKIIDRVRVAVAGSYEEFLLGCGAGA